MLERWREKRGFRAHETHRMDLLAGWPLASFRRRALAIGIDVVTVFVIKGIIGGFWHHGPDDADLKTMAGIVMEVAHRLRELVESVLYFSVAVKLSNGRTVGKWIMKVRIVSLTQARMSWWQSIERALGYGASLLEGGFGFFQYYINRNRQTVHDRIAETIVVYEGKKGLIDPPLPEDATA
jgi:uncharacterized RDD family membrane protein YckC